MRSEPIAHCLFLPGGQPSAASRQLYRNPELDFVHYVTPALAPASHNGQSRAEHSSEKRCNFREQLQ